MNPRAGYRRWSWFTSILFLIVAGASPGLSAHAFAATKPGPCATNSETRQLDYWLGDWTMPNAESGTNTSKVYLSLDKCMFVEHWDNGTGHVTEKMLAYTPEEKNWYGMFADNEGRVHIFSDGKVSSEAAEFHGKSPGTNGEVILNRLRIVRLSANNIEESWEKSTNNGASWTTAYRARYTRAKQ